MQDYRQFIPDDTVNEMCLFKSFMYFETRVESAVVSRHIRADFCLFQVHIITIMSLPHYCNVNDGHMVGHGSQN